MRIFCSQGPECFLDLFVAIRPQSWLSYNFSPSKILDFGHFRNCLSKLAFPKLPLFGKLPLFSRPVSRLASPLASITVRKLERLLQEFSLKILYSNNTNMSVKYI